MGVTKRQAAENRKAILAASERLFRERGVDGVGLAELMKEAGFTQGGFYNHFPSKDALAAEVVQAAVGRASEELAAALAGVGDRPGATLNQRVDRYLSREHSRDLEHGCAIAGLAVDVRRMGDVAQRHFGEGLSRIFDIFGTIANSSEKVELDQTERRQWAIAIYGQMIGVLLLARSVQSTDPALADEILTSGKAVLRNVKSESESAKQRIKAKRR
jgi:TetR/AcrR family transcriptional regulator, transcriptional repressor for nem operon